MDYAKNLRFKGYDLDGWKCKGCGEIYYPADKLEPILLLNKLKKMKYKLTLDKIKNNFIVRIPEQIGEILHFKKGAKMKLGLKNSKQLVILPMRKSEENDFFP